jgi:nucleoid-associated protein YgaU
MDSALEALVKSAAGTGAPTNPSSRYYGSAVEFFVKPDGTQVAYLERRLIPQPDVYAPVQEYVVVEGDRLDNIAAKFLGDPLLFWMICDANGTNDPDELTAQVGTKIKIPIGSGMTAAVRRA